MTHIHRRYDSNHHTIGTVVDILRAERATTRDDVARLLPSVDATYGALTCCEREAVLASFPATIEGGAR